MSEYLRFILERYGVPEPRTVKVLRYHEEWANRQIVDEIRILYPEASVRLVDPTEVPNVNVLIVPFGIRILFDAPGNRSFYRRVSQAEVDWVVLYGLQKRAIVAMPSNRLFRYYLREKLVERVASTLQTLRLWKPMSKAFQWILRTFYP